MKNINQIMYEKIEKVLNNAYCPYSNFKVGAILQTKSGDFFTGVNVENVSFSAGVCAERNAIFSAISNGVKKGEITRILIVNSKGIYSTPCGVCLQVMSEFLTPNSIVVLVDKEMNFKEYELKELLPNPFCEF